MDEERNEDLETLARARGVDPQELRREVSRFRLALDADLTVAAAAVADGEPAIARSVVDADVLEVGRLEQRLLTGVRAALPARRRRPGRRLAAVAVAAGLLGAAGGAAAAAVTVHPAQPPAVGARAVTSAEPVRSADTAPQDPVRVVAEGQARLLAYAVANNLPAGTIAAAAGALRATLLPLVSAAPGDPALADAVTGLLERERAVLAAVPAPDAQIAAAMAGATRLLGQLPARAATAFPRTASSGPAAVAGLPVVPSVPPAATPPAAPPSGGLPATSDTPPGAVPADNLP